MSSGNSVKIARVSHAKFVRHLQKKFTDELGFLPDAATVERIRQGNVAIAFENDEPAGFLLGAAKLSEAWHIRPIFQAAVQMDARRRHHGLKLLELVCAKARDDEQTIVQCFCRQELEANEFWQAAGFVQIALRHVNAKRGKPCVLWRKPLVKMTADTLAFQPANPRNHGAAGRSCGRLDFDALPQFTPFSTADVAAVLRSKQLCK